MCVNTYALNSCWFLAYRVWKLTVLQRIGPKKNAMILSYSMTIFLLWRTKIDHSRLSKAWIHGQKTLDLIDPYTVHLHNHYSSTENLMYLIRAKLWNQVIFTSHIVILEYFNVKNKYFLILPFSFSRYSLAPKTKIMFQMLCFSLGHTYWARPSKPILKNCQNGTFFTRGWKFFWAISLHLKCNEMCLRLRPCAYPCG